MSFSKVAGQVGSESSDAMMDSNSSNDSCGLCIHIKAFITIARTKTHSHATVVRTTSIKDANKLAIVSFPLAPFEIEETLLLDSFTEGASGSLRISLICIPSNARALDIVWHNLASATLARTSCIWRTSCRPPDP
nr:hypothetical protein AQUCO_00201453v1 [Ipomoea batatas]GMD85263.1 hypothetical protein AQUCO_00201453v1 [Ipomoea batatas]GMD88615.1 hypothetical protein AQUCO_00201453v1 [Ipomoea batatas]GMD91026.1 hypothetical protein AQUCO_00201453v1 [Ipomoea batatas]GME04648.1 hypothetical protein AQUCO_00201453v1 [Ipomoea batatas]